MLRPWYADRTGVPGLGARLRWRADAVSVAGDDRALIARTYIYLFGFGATVVLVTAAFPAPDAFLPGVLVPVLLAYTTVTVLLVGFDRLPQWFLVALSPLGSVLITVILVSAGSRSTVGYAMLYFWACFSAVYFFGRTIGLLNVAWIGLVFAVGLVLVDDDLPASAAVMTWVVSIAGLLVAAVLILLLRERTDRLFEQARRRAGRQAAVAGLSELALEGEEPEALMDGASAIVAEQLDVPCVEVLRALPGDEGMLLRAGVGWGDTGIRRVVVAGTGQPEHHSAVGVSAGLRVAIRGPGERAWGVLGAHDTTARSFPREDVDFVQVVANILSDALVRRDAEEEIRRRASYDDVTGLPNRALLLERLARALERTRDVERRVAVLAVDIDHFKAVNDAFGHEAGDRLVVALGARLREALLVTDTLARFGGDELVVLCEDVEGPDHAVALARTLRAAAARPLEVDGRPHRVTISVGIALGAGDVRAETVVRDADTAMYRAKERGRDTEELFDEELRTGVLHRLRVDQALRGAEERGELALVYQPLVELPRGGIVGVEALLRWNHPGLGHVSPADFVPVAEQSGLIVPLGRWVLEQALAQAARWHKRRAAGPFTVNVNLSARQISADDRLVETVASLLAEHRLRAGELALEVTESALMEDTDSAATTLERLRALGVRIVLDDFGTGYSSLRHVQRFPIDAIKIDRSFVATLGGRDTDEAIVSSIVRMADAFGLDVVAEGIERREQAERAHELGCRMAQGFYFARPAPPSELVLDAPLRTAASASSAVA
jgi:diguanylate cyclase (GGDEF)-like protein